MRRWSSARLGLVVLMLIALFSANTSAQNSGSKFRVVVGSVPDRYIVVFNEGAAGARGRSSRAAQVARDLTTTYGGRIRLVYNFALNGFAAEMPEGVARAISLDPRVAFVEEDGVVSTTDTQFNPPWGLDRVDQRNRPLDGAYSYSNNGSGVTAYVIDTGIRPTHTDFGGRAAVAVDFVGDGRNGMDCNGHGTHVAGTLGGNSYGVAKAVQIRAVRVLDCSGNGNNSWVIGGIDWVTGNRSGPAVANMSLGGPPNSSIDQAVRNSIASGVTYVIAAGNDNVDASTTSPARVSEAITVGATDINDVRAQFGGGQGSNFGAVLDVFAPGQGILSAWIGSDTATATLQGTSMATPHVAGIVARYLQANPGASPGMAAAAIVNNATAGVVGDPGAGSPNRLAFSGFLEAPPPPPPGGADTLTADQGLFAGQFLISSDGRFELDYQGDGNLVLYQGGTPLWASNTAGTSPGRALMQGDGNFVIYDAGGVPVWSSGTVGFPGAYLIVQNDGNVVIYSAAGSPLWATGTGGR